MNAVDPGDDDLLLLYGGTFDPVHLGHLAIAHAAHAVLGARVHLMPAADPPHRAPPGADAGHRARMLELAVAGDRALTVDRRELEREGRSYTVDTLSALRDGIGQQRPVALLLGADSFIGLPQWKDWRALFGLAHLVVAERDGHDLRELPAELAGEVAPRLTLESVELHALPAGRVLRLRQPLADVSATRVRAAIRSGGDCSALLPAAVAAYIDRHRLYANPGAASAPV
jgi:nicotinate-nucleotide adenylyltransferase